MLLYKISNLIWSFSPQGLCETTTKMVEDRDEEKEKSRQWDGRQEEQREEEVRDDKEKD